MSFSSGFNFGFNMSIVNNLFGGLWNPFGFGCCCHNYSVPLFFNPAVSMPLWQYPDTMGMSMPSMNVSLPSNLQNTNWPNSCFEQSMNFGNITMPTPSWGPMVDTFCGNSSWTPTSNNESSKFTKMPSDYKNKTNSSVKYDEYIVKYSNQFGVDANLARALIKQESGFNPNATSSANCKGLMQLSEATAKEMGVTNIYDPEQNIMGGVKYLKKMLDRYDGNMELAVAAYNAGPGKVKDSIPNISETKKHVKAVMKNYREYQNA